MAWGDVKDSSTCTWIGTYPGNLRKGLWMQASRHSVALPCHVELWGANITQLIGLARPGADVRRRRKSCRRRLSADVQPTMPATGFLRAGLRVRALGFSGFCPRDPKRLRTGLPHRSRRICGNLLLKPTGGRGSDEVPRCCHHILRSATAADRSWKMSLACGPDTPPVHTRFLRQACR